MQNNNRIARPYARAWFACALDAGELELYGEVLQSLSEQAALPEMEQLIHSPVICQQEIAKTMRYVLDKTLKIEASQLKNQVQGLLDVLAKNKRLSIIPAAGQAYLDLVAAHQDVRQVEVIAPYELSLEQKKSLDTKLQNYFAESIQLEYTVDPDLIGGIQVRSQDQVIDFSVVDQVQKLAQRMALKNYQTITS